MMCEQIGWPSAPTTGSCFFYSDAPRLQNYAGADWFQKPGTPAIPAPPPPTPCLPPPAEPACTGWSHTAAWKKVGCTTGGSNCVVSIEVTNSSGGRASINVLPFQPPRNMELAHASVTATVGKPTKDGLVSISVTSSATAMFVVLTTKAEGRFSDNAFLLEHGAAREILFYPWKELDEAMLSLLRSSLRVEHLAENVPKA